MWLRFTGCKYNYETGISCKSESQTLSITPVLKDASITDKMLNAIYDLDAYAPEFVEEGKEDIRNIIRILSSLSVVDTKTLLESNLVSTD